MEITDYLDAIRQSDLKEGICFYIDDYAMNSNVCYVPFPEVQNESLNFHNQTEGTAAPTIELMKGQTFDLTTIMYDTQDASREIVTDYLQNLTWTSSNPSVVAVNGGKSKRCRRIREYVFPLRAKLGRKQRKYWLTSRV